MMKQTVAFRNFANAPKTTGRYIISNVTIHKNHNTLQNFIPAFTSDTTDKYGIPIVKAEYYLMLYINIYISILCKYIP